MRRSYAGAALVLALVATACSDATTTSPVTPFDGVVARTLDDFIQFSIDKYLPKGFEDAVDARWSSIKDRKNAGDFDGAVRQLNTLSLWIDKKTGDITIPTGENVTKDQAAALIVLNMARWVYEGADADPQAVPTGDAALAVVPAGEPLQLVVPSLHASVTWDAGATQEDRIVVILEDPGTYPAQCQGPLPTRRCQYPLFYKVESYPHLRLQSAGRLAVCLVTTGDRRPIEYAADEPQSLGDHGPVGGRMRLAHNVPANAADYTPGSTVEDGIEILPLSTSQSNLADCDAPSTIGMAPLEKALHLAMRFAGKVLSPKEAYAYDLGPEHDFFFFSNFNAVDPASAPDLAIANATYSPGTIGTTSTPRSLSYEVTNVGRRSGGDATGAAVGVIARAYVSSDATLDETDALLGSASFGTMPPDGTPQPVTHSDFSLPIEGPVYLIVTAEQTNGLAEASLENNTTVINLNAGLQGDGFVGVWNGVLTPAGGTPGTGQPVSFIVTTQDGGTCTGEFRVAQSAGQAAYNQTRQFTSCDVEGTTSLFADIDPWVNPLNNAVRSTFAMTRAGDTMTGVATRFFIVNEVPTPEPNPWTMTLSRAHIPIVPLPAVILGANLTMQSSTASTTADAPASTWY